MRRFTNLRRSRANSVSTDWYESPVHIALRAVGSAFVILIIAVVAGLLVVPRLMGGDSLTVLTGSMEPTFSPGDVVVVKGVKSEQVCSDVSVGQIVTFFPEPNDPTLITHRVVGKTIGTFDDGTSCRLLTQGDANSAIDAPVSPAQVRGVFMYGIPKLGWARQWVAQQPMVLVGIGAVVLIAWMLWGGSRKPQTTVVSVPRPAGATRTSEAPGAPVTPVAPVAPLAEPRVDLLREREIALRERELALRERELELALEQRAEATFNVPPTPPLCELDQNDHTTETRDLA